MIARHTVSILFYVLLIGTTLIIGSTAAADPVTEQQLLTELQEGNHVILLRHALAPGIGDPDHFQVDDCQTQRNLSQAGRDQAVRIGARLQQAGITEADVYTSQWCRCIETAELLGLGEPVEFSVLNSFFRNFDREKAQTAALQKWLMNNTLKRPAILVTHQVNITALTSIFPDSGEMVLMRKTGDGNLEVVGSIHTE